MAKFLKRQNTISMFRAQPANETHKTSQSVDIGPESPTFQYLLAGVLTPDAGQPAGTAVIATTVFDNIHNSTGNMMGTELDTSVTFTSTALTNERMWPWDEAEPRDDTDVTSRLASITKYFAPGDYCIDYVEGIIYGVKASAQTALAALNYKVRQPAANGTFVIPPTINLVDVGGAAITLGQDVMASSLPVVIASNQSPIQVITDGGTTLLDGSNTAAAATPTALAGVTTIQYVIVQAKTTNTKSIFVGNAGSQNIELGKGDFFSFGINDLNKVYFTTQVNGEGINYSAVV